MSAPETIEYYQVDAFTERLFGGNPAGVCILQKWLPDHILQLIAAENNLSETAFMLATGGHFELRWFTPRVEIGLCGHATLASAFVLFEEKKYPGKSISFVNVKEGYDSISVERGDGKIIILNFPAWACREILRTEVPDALIKGLKLAKSQRFTVFRSTRDYLVRLDSEDAVRRIKPDFKRLCEVVDTLGIIVTAEGAHVDFVSRFFEPGAGIDEDPVTGSAHCALIPFWADILKKTNMKAQQLSTRGGILFCELHRGAPGKPDRVGIGGHAVLYSSGKLCLPKNRS